MYWKLFFNPFINKKKFLGTYIGKNFSFAKNYLYHTILKYTIQYDANKKDIYYYFASIRFLYKKGIYVGCSKMLKQAFKKAENENDYLSILRVIEFTRLLLHSYMKSYEELRYIVEQEPEILKKTK